MTGETNTELSHYEGESNAIASQVHRIVNEVQRQRKCNAKHSQCAQIEKKCGANAAQTRRKRGANAAQTRRKRCANAAQTHRKRRVNTALTRRKRGANAALTRR